MKFIKRVRCFFPSRLPQGMKEFNQFVADVAELSDLPNNLRLRTVISMFILKLPPEMISFPKWRLAKQLKKAAANQVASEVLSVADEEKKSNTEPTAKDLG